MNFSFLRKLSFGLVISGALFFIAGIDKDVHAQKVRLRAQITPECGTTSLAKFADISADGNLAVQGSYNCRGVFIYDVSNPDAPTLAAWYNPGNNLQFLEAVVIGNRGYFGSGNGGGVHIVDLSVPANPQLLGIVNSTNGNGFNSIHEMIITGNFLIENFNGFSTKVLKVINISNPASPVFVRDINPTEVLWVHAMHIRGNRMFTSGWGTGAARGRTEIYDITNIGAQAPTLLGYIEDTSSVTAGNNMHSSWSSEDGNYLYSCRETSNGNADLRTYNISNPAQPLLVNKLGMGDLNLNATSPHNPVVMGNYLYVSWYEAGMQIFDLTDPAVPKRVGQYDSYQAARAEPDASKSLTEEPWDMICGLNRAQNNLPTGFDGNWAVYPFLGQNKVLMGDLKNGLLVVDASGLNRPAKTSCRILTATAKPIFRFTRRRAVYGKSKTVRTAIRNSHFSARRTIKSSPPITTAMVNRTSRFFDRATAFGIFWAVSAVFALNLSARAAMSPSRLIMMPTAKPMSPCGDRQTAPGIFRRAVSVCAACSGEQAVTNL